jgi:AcrR family transcriptional regulator
MPKKKRTAGISSSLIKGVKMNRAQRGKQIASLRKRQITRAAYEIIAEKGYYNFTMMDIAKRAGVSSGLIHHYFKDKENMLVTLLREMQQVIRSTTEKAIKTEEDPKRRLEVLIDTAFSLVESDREYLYVIFDFLTQIKLNERMRRILGKLYRGYRDIWIQILDDGMKKGVFIEMDLHFVSSFCVAAILGLEQMYVVDNSAFFYRDYTKRIRNLILDMLIIKPKPESA